jgi:hypothetical protein
LQNGRLLVGQVEGQGHGCGSLPRLTRGRQCMPRRE